jgi:hypothetical protein
MSNARSPAHSAHLDIRGLAPRIRLESGTVDSKVSYTRGVRDKLWDYRSDYQSIKASDAKVAIYGGAALVHCYLRIDVTAGGVPEVVDSIALA